MATVGTLDLLQRVKVRAPKIVLILRSEYVQGESIAETVGDESIQKLLIKLWEMEPLHEHIAESFQ
ncbi:hypothetical protein [Burkholderia sp. AW49-1]